MFITNEKKKSKDNSKNPYNTKSIVRYSIFILLGIPLIINCILYLPFPPTPKDLSNKEWLPFWGSVLGGSFGGVATLLAFIETIKYYKRKDKANENIEILRIKPYIQIRIGEGEGPGKNLYDIIRLTEEKALGQKEDIFKSTTVTKVKNIIIRNVGLGSAIDIKTRFSCNYDTKKSNRCLSLSKDDEFKAQLELKININTTEGRYEGCVEYKDMIDTNYKQDFTLIYYEDKIFIETITKPEKQDKSII